MGMPLGVNGTALRSQLRCSARLKMSAALLCKYTFAPIALGIALFAALYQQWSTAARSGTATVPQATKFLR